MDQIRVAATVAIRAVIGLGLQEFVQQIAVGRVDFHAVKPSLPGSFGSPSIILADAR
jgi:hypothetical protein